MSANLTIRAKLNSEEIVVTILELKKLIDEYCQQHAVSFEVALYMLKVAEGEDDE